VRPQPRRIVYGNTRAELFVAPLSGLTADLRLFSEAERARAARFLSGPAYDQFVLGRTFLRQALGARIGIAPERCELVELPGGRPMLANPCGLDFNLSHSGDRLFVAIVENGVVGVDVEAVNWQQNFEAVRAAFSTAELARFASLDARERVREFFRIWTQKESFVKALGQGLSYPLDSLSLETDSRGLFRDPATDEQWLIQSWNEGEEYSFSLCLREKECA